MKIILSSSLITYIKLNKRDVLASITFGQRIAEDEADTLVSYLVETDQWQKVISGHVDVIYGPMGSGKSALYLLLRKKRSRLNARDIIPVAGENVRGTPIALLFTREQTRYPGASSMGLG